MRDEILKLVQQSGDALHLRLFGLHYTFDFPCTPVATAKGRIVRIGANEVDMPLVVDQDSGAIFIVGPHDLCFINSSFRQLLESFAFAASWPVPDDLPDDQRAAIFRSGLMAIDAPCFADDVGPDGFWAQVEEEIEMGVV